MRITYVPIVGIRQRTSAECILLAESANTLSCPQMGVKGPSALILLPRFDYIRGMVPDYMHLVCLGVVRQFTNLLVSPESSGTDYHLSRKALSEIDEYIIKIKAPQDIRRNPRGLRERNYWKATEWRAFLLLYSPIIFAFYLPRPYYKHWMTLACAMHLILQQKVSQNDLNTAELLLVTFCTGVETLYGAEHCTYNVHCLQHLVECIRDCGLPWATSAFIFEDLNGKILNLFFGTRSVPNQICKYFTSHKTLVRMGDDLFQDAPESILELFCYFTGRSYISKSGKKIKDVVVLGKGFIHDIAAEEEVALINSNLTPVHDSCQCYNRCIIAHKLYTTHSYDVSFKRCNSVIYTTRGYGIIKSIAYIQKHCTCDNICNCQSIVLFCKRLNVIHPQGTLYAAETNINISHFLTRVILSDVIFACETSNVLCKCILISHNDITTVIKIPVFEHD